jgi:hypothetical protein
MPSQVTGLNFTDIFGPTSFNDTQSIDTIPLNETSAAENITDAIPDIDPIWEEDEEKHF